MLNFFKNKYPDPINAKTRRLILDKIVTPEFKEIGLEWNGNSQWIGPSESGIRKVIKYNLSKGLMGVFIWGFCYDFLPVTNGKGVSLQRTFKSARPQLFEFSTTTNNFQNGKSKLENGITTTWGKRASEKSIKQLISKRKKEIIDWFEHGSTLHGSLEIANEQMTNSEYNTHWPNPKYVASFIHAKMGEKEKGIELLKEIQIERLNFNKELFEKLKKRLIEL